MAHEISQVTINGQIVTEAMFTNKPAWHGLGTIFDENGTQAPDSPTAIQESHLGWTVGKEPLRLAQDGTAVDGFFALVRQDTRATLNVVGNEYVPLQNCEAFAFLDSLLQDGIMRYESAFALQGGKKVCLLARMPSIDYVTAEDAIKRYILFCTSHGGGAITATPTAVRVVCANTLRIALQCSTQTLSIRHSGNLQAKLNSARNYLSQCDKAFTKYREDAQVLLKGYTPSQATAYIDALYPAPTTDSARALTTHTNKLDELKRFFASQANTLATVKGTWWSLFNAVTESVDHGKPARQASDMRARAENRFLSVTAGDGADFKASAFDMALAMSA